MAYMSKGFVLLVLVACVLVPRVYSQSAVRYILPSDEEVTSNCPVSDSSQCITLSQLVNSTRYESDTHYKFIGSHYDLEGVLRIMDTENVTISGMVEDVPIIECSAGPVNSGLVVMNVTVFRMQDISLLGCHVEMIQEELMIDRYARTFLNFSRPMTAGVYLNYLYDVSLINVNIRNSTRYGILAFNLLGDTIIKNTVISDSNRISYRNLEHCAGDLGLNCKGGNFALVYTDLLYCPNKEVRYSLTITDSMFINGVDGGIAFVTFIPEARSIPTNGVQFIGGAGLGIQMMQSSYGVDAVIDNCTMDNNAGFISANLYLLMWDFVDNSTITIANSSIINGKSHLEMTSGGTVTSSNFSPGFYFEYGILPLGTYSPVCEAERKYETEIFTMEDCLVGNNAAILTDSAIGQYPKSFFDHPRYVTLRRVQFIENNGDVTIVLWGQGLNPSGFKTYLIDCEFHRNFYLPPSNTVIGSSNHQIVYQISVLYVEYVNCTWRDNDESPIHAIQSRLVFTGENRFINNTGVNGGGLEMQEGSELFLQSGSKTIFVDNHARMFGGAIYASMLSYRCFFQLDSSKELPELMFTNNSAMLAGQSVYGTFRLCIVGQDADSGVPLDLFLKISSFSEPVNLNSSVISGDAIGLCLCFEESFSTTCINDISYHDLYTSPGKEFVVKVEAYAFANSDSVGGQTTAEVVATIADDVLSVDSLITNASLKSTLPQPIQKGCNEARFTIMGYENQTIPLTLAPASDRLYFPAFIRVHLGDCPNGFVHSSEELSCICAPLFVDNRIDCNLETHQLIKSSSQWIGYVDLDGDEGGPILAVGSCNTIEYCGEATEIVLDDPGIRLTVESPQCAKNRAGTICGQCIDGYSLALGSSDCLDCSNNYHLALLVFFILAGPLWIAFLSFFNLTVSTGRINGMLFYANVLRMANYEFFGYTDNPAFYIFKIMIDWINLDFGIISCFYDGFDYYAKAWFNFAFPFYLFTILFIIVLCANRFTKFTQILPKNILSVLTTIILIGFTKLLRASFAVAPFQSLDTENGDLVVWDFDGSLEYFGLRHGFLFVFALLVLLLLLIPYSLVMISYPYLQSFTAHEDTIFERFVCFIRTRIFKFKPLLETYDGPYISTHRYYTGLQTVLRLVILFITSTSYTSGATAWFKALCISIISLILLVLVIFKNIYLCPINKLVEVLYLGNLVVLEFVLLILQLLTISYYHQGIAISVSVAFGFVIFVFVIVYERYLILAPRIYKFLGKPYTPPVHYSAQGREIEEEKKTKLDRNDQTNQIIDLIDENYREMNESRSTLQSKEEALIQNLIAVKEHPTTL